MTFLQHHRKLKGRFCCKLVEFAVDNYVQCVVKGLLSLSALALLYFIFPSLAGCKSLKLHNAN